MRNLIVYSSRKGSSKKLAELLAEKLAGDTTLANVKDKPSLENFDNVILGGAVLAGEIKGGMRQFTESNIETLKHKKIALFVCCLDNNAENIKNYFVKIYPQILIDQSVASECLGGAYDPQKENFLMRFILKLMKSKTGEFFKLENLDKIADKLKN